MPVKQRLPHPPEVPDELEGVEVAVVEETARGMEDEGPGEEDGECGVEDERGSRAGSLPAHGRPTRSAHTAHMPPTMLPRPFFESPERRSTKMIGTSRSGKPRWCARYLTSTRKA